MHWLLKEDSEITRLQQVKKLNRALKILNSQTERFNKDKGVTDRQPKHQSQVLVSVSFSISGADANTDMGTHRNGQTSLCAVSAQWSASHVMVASVDDRGGEDVLRSGANHALSEFVLQTNKRDIKLDSFYCRNQGHNTLFFFFLL